jgi:calcineurin-like phosphoesterase family protein
MEDKVKIFVTSDTWFNRPCGTHYGERCSEYNMNIVKNWNSVVSENDTVYVLGGFGIGDIYDMVFRLNGNIVFMDMFLSPDEDKAREMMTDFIGKSVDVTLRDRISFSEKQIKVLYHKDVVLSYFPLADWYGRRNGSVCFHGMDYDTDMNNNNICCNASKWDFKPVDIDSVVTNMEKFKSML